MLAFLFKNVDKYIKVWYYKYRVKSELKEGIKMKKVYVIVLTVNGTVVWLEVCSSIKNLMEELKGVACDFNGEKLDAYLKTVTEDTFKIA